MDATGEGEDMTDWMAKTQAGVDRWLETQRQFWEAMLREGPGSQAGAPTAAAMDDLQRRTIEAWRQAAYRIVDGQAEMLLGAVRDRPATDGQDLVRRWTDAQREMWQGWLAVAGQGAQAAKEPQDLATAGKQMVDALREAAERLVRSQAEWAKAWSDAAAEEPRRPGGGDGEPTG